MLKRDKRNGNDYKNKIYGIVLLKKYDIDAIEDQERKEGSAPLTYEIHGLRNVIGPVPLWLVGQTDGSDWHQWIIAIIDTYDIETAKDLYVQGKYNQILSLSYTDCIDEWYNRQKIWEK